MLSNREHKRRAASCEHHLPSVLPVVVRFLPRPTHAPDMQYHNRISFQQNPERLKVKISGVIQKLSVHFAL